MFRRAPKAIPEHTRHRFLVLDAMRGVAALLVVLFHAGFYLSRAIVPHANLAVDFFFLLSGFIITYAYGQRLDRGLSLWVFLKARFARLYPLYALSMALAILGLAVQIIHFHLRSALPSYGLQVVTGLLLLPLHKPSVPAFPLNIPAWSLFGEIVANLVHALFLRRRSTLTLVLWLLLWGTLLLLAIRHYGACNFGGLTSEVLPGLLRVLFSYTLGILLFRFFSNRSISLAIPAWLPCLLLALALLLPVSRLAVADPIFLAIVFPCLLLLGAQASCAPPLLRPAHRLGELSYPLYILHAPTIAILTTLGYIAHVRPSAGHLLAILAIVLVVSALAEFFYDRPARVLLRNRLQA